MKKNLSQYRFRSRLMKSKAGVALTGLAVSQYRFRSRLMK